MVMTRYDKVVAIARLIDAAGKDEELKPDEYREKHGRCPDGYEYDPLTDKCMSKEGERKDEAPEEERTEDEREKDEEKEREEDKKADEAEEKKDEAPVERPPSPKTAGDWLDGRKARGDYLEKLFHDDPELYQKEAERMRESGELPDRETAEMLVKIKGVDDLPPETLRDKEKLAKLIAQQDAQRKIEELVLEKAENELKDLEKRREIAVKAGKKPPSFDPVKFLNDIEEGYNRKLSGDTEETQRILADEADEFAKIVSDAATKPGEPAYWWKKWWQQVTRPIPVWTPGQSQAFDDLGLDKLTGASMQVTALTKPIKTGPFVVDPARQSQVVVDNALAELKQAARLIKRAGVRLPTGTPIALKGLKRGMRGASKYTDGQIFMSPGHLSLKGTDLVGIFVHELAHYIHDRILAGGFSNKAISNQWAQVVHMKVRDPETEFVDGPPDLSKLASLPAWIDKQVRPETLALLQRRLKAQEQSIWKQAMRKGVEFKMEGADDPFGPYKPYVRHMRVLSGTKSKVKVEVLNPSESDLVRSGGKKVIEIVTPESLRGAQPFKAVYDEFASLRSQAQEKELRLRADSRHVQKYADVLNDWVPTQYALTNHKEWWAELFTKYVLDPTSVDANVKEWITGVINSKGKVTATAATSPGVTNMAPREIGFPPYDRDRKPRKHIPDEPSGRPGFPPYDAVETVEYDERDARMQGFPPYDGKGVPHDSETIGLPPYNGKPPHKGRGFPPYHDGQSVYEQRRRAVDLAVN